MANDVIIIIIIIHSMLSWLELCSLSTGII